MASRRTFIQHLTIGSTGLLLPPIASAHASQRKKKRGKLKFGMIADLHVDLIPDAEQRLDAFMAKVADESPDWIISLGDFCFGKPENEPYVRKFARAGTPAYHVLGNHDMDKNTKDDMTTFFGISGRYYSFDSRGYHLVVLDANNLYRVGQYTGYQNGNYYIDDEYREFVDDTQVEWFKADISKTDLPIMVFSHQSLYHPTLGIKNRLLLQVIMEEENRKAGHNKVIACFNGHNHLDFHREINGIHYFDINSISYHWFSKPDPARHDQSVYEKKPYMQNVGLYRDPLFAFVSIESEGNLVVKGVQSEWVSATDAQVAQQQIFGSKSFPVISDYIVKI